MAEQLYTVSGRPKRNAGPPKRSTADYATSQPQPKHQSPPPNTQSTSTPSTSAPTTIKLTLNPPAGPTSDLATPHPPPTTGNSSPLTDLEDSPPNKSDQEQPQPPTQPASPTDSRSRRSSTTSASLKVKLPATKGVRSSKRGRAAAEEPGELVELPTPVRGAKKGRKQPKIRAGSADGSPEPGAPVTGPVAAAEPEPTVMDPAAAPAVEAILDKLVEPETAAPPTVIQPPSPIRTDRTGKRSSKLLDPAVPAFKPKPPAAPLERTHSRPLSASASPAPSSSTPLPTPALAPAPAPAPKKSIFEVNANPLLPFTRKKPGAGAAAGAGTPSLFAPKPATPLGRPKPAGAGAGTGAGGAAGPGGVKADDKGGKIWANLVGKGQLPDAKVSTRWVVLTLLREITALTPVARVSVHRL